MHSLKQILSISLPITIVLLIFSFAGNWGTVGPILLGLAILQGIFWKFVKWNF
ncbi:hypothetical protein ISS04_03230 [Candidatus Woesearchaeota archaeon]|nr:hypothetical protein [Candidatus Woesearchaeota archaeon]